MKIFVVVRITTKRAETWNITRCIPIICDTWFCVDNKKTKTPDHRVPLYNCFDNKPVRLLYPFEIRLKLKKISRYRDNYMKKFSCRSNDVWKGFKIMHHSTSYVDNLLQMFMVQKQSKLIHSKLDQNPKMFELVSLDTGTTFWIYLNIVQMTA